MKRIPEGRLTTVGDIRELFAKRGGADFYRFRSPPASFVSIAAWASRQRAEDPTPYWRTLKAHGELNAKYPGGIKAQKALLEAEGHTVIARGHTNIRYYVKDYEKCLFPLNSLQD